MSASAGRAISRILFYLIITVILVYTLFPFYWALRSSISPNADLFSTPVSYFPRHPTFGNYRLVFENRQFVRSLLNSVIVAFSVTALSLVIGTIGSYALGRFKFHGRTAVLY